LGRRGVDLRPSLTIAGHAIQADAGDQGGIARALGRLDVGSTEAAVPVPALPAEQAADDEGLPGQQHEGLAFELTAVEAEHVLEVTDRSVGRVLVPGQTALPALLLISQVPLAGVANVRPGDDASVNYILGKGGCTVISTFPRSPFA